MPAVRICVLAIAGSIAGCASAPPQQMTWQRTDGKYFSNEQLQADRAFCQGEVAKAGLSDAGRAQNDYGVYANSAALQRVS